MKNLSEIGKEFWKTLSAAAVAASLITPQASADISSEMAKNDAQVENWITSALLSKQLIQKWTKLNRDLLNCVIQNNNSGKIDWIPEACNPIKDELNKVSEGLWIPKFWEK